MPEEPADLAGRIDRLLAHATDEQEGTRRHLGRVLDDLKGSVAGLHDKVAGASDEIAAARASFAGVGEALSRELAGCTTQLGVRIDTLETAVGQLLAANVVEEPAALRRDLEEISAAVRSAREVQTMRTASLETRVEETAAAVASAVAALEGELLERLATVDQTVLEQAGSLDEDLTGGIERFEASVVDRLEHAEATLAERSSRSVEALRETARALDGAVKDRLAAADRASGERFHGLEEKVEAGRRDINGAIERIGEFERAIVAYLRARDRVLEEERDRFFVSLLEETLDGLSRKKKAAAVGRYRKAAGSRRDRADARRYRAGERPAPEVDEALLRGAVEEIMSARSAADGGEPEARPEIPEAPPAPTPETEIVRPAATPARARKAEPAASRKPRAKKPVPRKPEPKKPEPKKPEPKKPARPDRPPR